MSAKLKKMSFEEAMIKLEEIVTRLENADVPLEEAMAQFQEGIQLSQYLKQTLDNAEETITKIVKENGELIDLPPKS